MAGIETAQVAIIENVEIHRLRDIFFQCFFFFPWPIHFDLTCKRSDSPPPSLQKNTLEKGEKEGGEQEGRGGLPSITYKQKKRGALKNFGGR
jgi:hypothetical protein